MDAKVGVIGGAGRIGLVLSATLNQKHRVEIYDTNTEAIERLRNEKRANFHEPELDALLQLSCPNIINSLEDLIYNNDIIFITIGTSVDEYLNPDFKPIFKLFREIKEIISGEKEGCIPIALPKIFVISSTVYPGTSKKIQKLLGNWSRVAFCPERMATGMMVKELKNHLQLVSADQEYIREEIAQLFEDAGIRTFQLRDTTEGELAKLFTNAYRYINFSISNYFYMLCDDLGADFYAIFDAMTYKYPRMRDFPKPLFTGGSCLIKDTLQLASVTNSFQLGYAAYRVNEHLPLHIFRKVRKLFDGDLSGVTVGILGMAFKGDTDDTRDSLAYRMKNIFINECKEVLCSDSYVKDPTFVDEGRLFKDSDVIIIGAYHMHYWNYNFKGLGIPVIDVFNKFI